MLLQKAHAKRLKKLLINGMRIDTAFLIGAKTASFPERKKDRKGNTAWSIPSDARRPIDSKLIQEILWRVLESDKPQRDALDLTDWGIGLFDTPECIEVLTSSGYIKSAGDGGQLSLTKKGYSILGRYGFSAKDAALPVPLQ